MRFLCGDLLPALPVDVEINRIKEVLIAFGDESRQLALDPGPEALPVSGVVHLVEDPGAEEDLATGVLLALPLYDAGPEGVHPGLERLLFPKVGVGS